MRTPVGIDAALSDADVVVLHSGWTWHNARAAASARRLGIPYILEPRGAYDPSIVSRRPAAKRLWWMTLERKVVIGARGIHVFFEEERAHLDQLGYTGPVLTVSNGVDAPPADAWDGGSGGYVLWLGRFDPEHKGLDVLLAALRLLPSDRRPPVWLHGPDWRNRKSEVERWIRDSDLREHVTIGPAVHGEEKRRLLIQALGFVYPSRWDACPNAVLEAVSLGVPTLVTPYPLGCFLARRQGAILSQGDPAALAEGLRRLQSRDAADVGRRGADVTRTELTWNQVARSWLTQTARLL